MKAAFRRIIARLLEHQVRRLIRRHQLKVVAVGGSVGKTSTKLFIATVLRQKYRVLAHESNYNTEIGLPLSVFDMHVPAFLLNPFAWAARLIRMELAIRGTYPFDILVLELGTDHPGEIPLYLRYLSPTLGVTTAVTPEHMEGFPGGISEVAAEELSLARASQTFLANHDDILPEHRKHYIDPHPAHHYYGSASKLEYTVKIISTDPVGGTIVDIAQAGRTVFSSLKLHVYGAHSAKAALAAYGAADLLGFSHRQMKAGLEAIRPVPGRMRTFAGINGSIIVDDTYNSSPEAIDAALVALASAPVTGRRIALLGSMNELGPDAPSYHEQAGIAAAGVDLLITLGQIANTHLGPAAVRAGLDPSRYHAATSPYAAGEYLGLILAPGDVLIAKGSQNGVFAEEALKVLLADPADAAQLVRQSPAWLRAKAKQFPDAPAHTR